MNSQEEDSHYLRAGPLEPKVLKQILYEEAGGRLQFLGRISDAEGSLVRTFFSPAHIRAASQVRPIRRLMIQHPRTAALHSQSAPHIYSLLAYQ